MNCPACGYGLKPERADACTFAACDLCGGISVETLKSLQLWAAFHAQSEPLPALLGAEVPRRAARCWKCQGTLEDFAYMENRDILLQRCGPCRLLWVPGDQQEGARAAWAKRTGREGRRLERKADMSAAYRPSKRRMPAGLNKGAHVSVGGDLNGQVDYMLNERQREREED